MNQLKKTAFAAALLCAALPALAQDAINPSWYIQPSVSGFKPDGRFGTDEKDWGAGLKFGKAVHPMWDIQIGGVRGRADNGVYNYHQTLLGVDALLMLSRQNFRPFVLFGVGAERDKVDNPLRNVAKTSPYYSAGIGFQLGLNDRWSLQADLRGVRGHLRDDERFGFSRSVNKYLTVGLNYAFNPPPAPPAPAPAPAPVVAAPEPAPAPAPVTPPPPPARFEKVTLSATELFAFDSATLTLPQPKLDEIAAALQAAPSITDVDVTGYTDRLGSTKYNQKLSERRANAVRDYLVGKGVDGSRLKAVGRGEENPVAVCNQKKRSELIECLAPNRRVEVEQITIERRVQ